MGKTFVFIQKNCRKLWQLYFGHLYFFPPFQYMSTFAMTLSFVRSIIFRLNTSWCSSDPKHLIVYLKLKSDVVLVNKTNHYYNSKTCISICQLAFRPPSSANVSMDYGADFLPQNAIISDSSQKEIIDFGCQPSKF